MLFYDDLDTYVAEERRKLDALRDANIPAVGKILEVYGPAEDQDIRTNLGGHSVTRPVDALCIDHEGILGDRHRTLTRRSTPREAPLYELPRATIVNRRQLVAVSPCECRLLSERLELDVTPQLLGANLLIGREDGADFSISRLPINTYLAIAGANDESLPVPPAATLIHYVQQKGCGRTGRALAKAYGDDSLVERFKAVSEFERGILLTVEYPVDEPVELRADQQVFFRFPMGSVY